MGTAVKALYSRRISYVRTEVIGARTSTRVYQRILY